MLFVRDRDGQRQSRLQSDASAEEAVSDLLRALSALPGVSRTMQIVPGFSRSSRMFAAVCGLLCGVVFALAIPRMGPWALTLTLPFCVGAGFVWGHRVRAKESRDALDKLKSRLAHELNNPLAILIDQLDSAVSELERTSLAQGLRRAPELKALADDALAAASRIARVVRDLDASAPAALEQASSDGRFGRAPRERVAPTKSGPIPKPVRARILVIDDEPQVAASLRRMLYRHDVTVATTGFEAQSLIQHHEFDVIVSDVMMPEPSGMDVFERLTRTDPELARRFVFVTGGTYTSQARDFLASIPNARLGKPVDALALDRAIAEIHHGFEPSAATHTSEY